MVLINNNLPLTRIDTMDNNTPQAGVQPAVTPNLQATEIDASAPQTDYAIDDVGSTQAVEATPEAAVALAKLENKDTSKMNKNEKQVHEKKLQKFKIKVYGRETEEELDLNDHTAVGKKLQMAAAAQQKMQEAAEMRSSAEEFINILKTDPRRILTDPNIDVDLKKLAQEILEEEIANSQKSPEQLKAEKLQKELEDLKNKYEKEEKTRKSREQTRLQQQYEVDIQNNIESALKTSDLPKTPYTVRKMAEMMMFALQNGKEVTPNELVPIIRKQMQADIKELFGAANDDILEELVGKDRISSLRKKRVAAVKQQQIAQTANQIKAVTNKTPEPAKVEKRSMKDWLNGKTSFNK